MGYNTIIGRQFINLGDGRYIPLVLTTCSNCFDLNNRKVRETYPLYVTDSFANTPKEFDDFVDETLKGLLESYKDLKETNPGYYDNESYSDEEITNRLGWFITFYVNSNRSMSAKQIKTWFANGVKEALTIEEIKDVLGYDSERGTPLSFMIKKDGVEEIISIFNSNDLIEFLDKYPKLGDSYLRYYSLEYDLKHFNRYRKYKKKPINKIKVEQDFSYVLHNEKSGGYFYKKTKYGYKYSHYINSGKRFKSEADANRMANKVVGYKFVAIKTDLPITLTKYVKEKVD